MKWFLIFLAFSGPDLIHYEIFFGAEEAQCRDKKKEILAMNRPGDRVIFYADCHPIGYTPPVVDPKKPNDKKSEVTS